MLFNNSVNSSVDCKKMNDRVALKDWYWQWKFEIFKEKNLSQWHFRHHKFQKMAVYYQRNVPDIGHCPSTTKKDHISIGTMPIHILANSYSNLGIIQLWNLCTFSRSFKQIFGNYLNKISFIPHPHILLITSRSPRILEA